MKHRPLTGLVLLALTAAASAEESATDAPPEDLNLLEIVSQGGIMMYPLALLSVAAVILIFLFFFCFAYF